MNSQMVEQPLGLSPIPHTQSLQSSHQQQTPDPDAIKMFVGQIPKAMSEEELREMFEEFGTVYELNVLRDKIKQESRGCCFVTFHKRSAALEAQNKLHNVKMMAGMRHPIQMKPADCENRNVEERKLFVGMVAKKHNENDVRVMFSAYGTIEECHVLRDTSGNSRGCAFVTFSTRQSALNAIKALHHSTTMEGCSSPLVVKFADTQREKDAKRLQTMAQSFFPGNLAQTMNALTPQYIAPRPMQDQTSSIQLQTLYQLMQQALASGNQATMNGMQQLAGLTALGNMPQLAALAQAAGQQQSNQGVGNTNLAAAAAAAAAAAGNGSLGGLSMGGGLSGLNAGGGLSGLSTSNTGGLGGGLGGMMTSGVTGATTMSSETNATNSLVASLAAAAAAASSGSGTSVTNTPSSFSGLGGMGNLSGGLQGLGGGLSGGLGGGLSGGLSQSLSGLSGMSGFSGTGLSSGLSGMNGLGASAGLNTSTGGSNSLDMNALSQAYSGIQQYTGPQNSSISRAQFNGFGANAFQPQQPQKQKEGPEGANLFIYHLPQELMDADLLQTFLPFGNVISAKVFIDKVTNMSKCFGFVSYDNPVSAQAAIQAMNGFQIGTKRLKVQLKRSKETGKPY